MRTRWPWSTLFFLVDKLPRVNCFWKMPKKDKKKKVEEEVPPPASFDLSQLTSQLQGSANELYSKLPSGNELVNDPMAHLPEVGLVTGIVTVLVILMTKFFMRAPTKKEEQAPVIKKMQSKDVHPSVRWFHYKGSLLVTFSQKRVCYTCTDFETDILTGDRAQGNFTHPPSQRGVQSRG